MKRRIIRVVNELLDAGAIERVKAAHRGQRAEYRVTCDLYGQDVLPLAAGR